MTARKPASALSTMMACALDEKRKRKGEEAKAATLNAMEEDVQQQAAEPAQRVTRGVCIVQVRQS